MRTYASLQALIQELETDARAMARVRSRNRTAWERWHMGLVEKMRLDIPGVRPAFLETDEQLAHLRQILRFRHRLRHLYGEDLDPAKTREIQAVVDSFFSAFPDLHKRFTSELRSIADAL